MRVARFVLLAHDNRTELRCTADIKKDYKAKMRLDANGTFCREVRWRCFCLGRW